MEKELLVKLIATNLEFIEKEIITLIPNDYAKISAKEVLQRLVETVEVLSDDVLDNKNQLAIIWGSFTSDPEIVAVFNGLLSELVKKLDDEQLQVGLLLLQKPLIQSFIVLTDTNQSDGAQLKTIWNSFLSSPEFIQLIISNLGWILGKVIKNDNLRETILKLINLFK